MPTVVSDSKPETAAEALARWDNGDVVWTAEMGGLGPGYEQVIHIMAFEVVRELLSREPLDWYWAKAETAETDADAKRECRAFADLVEKTVLARVRDLGSSGAQWGAAQNLAYIVVRKGWRKALDELAPDRLIQIDRTWPRLESATATNALDPRIIARRLSGANGRHDADDSPGSRSVGGKLCASGENGGRLVAISERGAVSSLRARQRRNSGATVNELTPGRCVPAAHGWTTPHEGWTPAPDSPCDCGATTWAIAEAVKRIRFWLVQSCRYTASTIELEEVLTREISAVVARGTAVGRPPHEPAAAADRGDPRKLEAP